MHYGWLATALIQSRFTELVCDRQTLEAVISEEEEPGFSALHKAVFNTMATCHSLREVDNELLGDPLDLKMFEFTGWTYQEGGRDRQKGLVGDKARIDRSLGSGLSPPVVCPPGKGSTARQVSFTSWLIYTDWHRSWEFSRPSSSSLNCVGRVLW